MYKYADINGVVQDRLLQVVDRKHWSPQRIRMTNIMKQPLAAKG